MESQIRCVDQRFGSQMRLFTIIPDHDAIFDSRMTVDWPSIVWNWVICSFIDRPHWLPNHSPSIVWELCQYASVLTRFGLNQTAEDSCTACCFSISKYWPFATGLCFWPVGGDRKTQNKTECPDAQTPLPSEAIVQINSRETSTWAVSWFDPNLDLIQLTVWTINPHH